VEFHRLAKVGSETDGCSDLLKRMELEDFKGEEMMDEEDMLTMEYAGIILAKVNQEVSKDKHKEKQQKRKPQWGPIQRVPWPRRFLEDGKSYVEGSRVKKLQKSFSRYQTVYFFFCF
jgi:hypothetical protein